MRTQTRKTLAQILLTGECCVPENSNPRVVEDHIARYNFAASFVKNKSVLDIACGAGYGSNILKKAGAKSVLGLDINKNALKYANKKYQIRNITFSYGDINKLSFKEKFDTVVCFETVEHIQNDLLAIKNLYRALIPGGLLIISSPNRPITSPKTNNINDKPLNKFHVREYTPNELRSLLVKGGFSHVETYGQRPRLYLRWRLFNSLYEIAFNPNYRAHSKLKKLWLFTPRYFVMVVKK